MAFLRSENGVLYTVSCAEAATRSLKEASLIPSSSALRVTVLVDSLRFHWGLRAIHVQMWMFYAHVLLTESTICGEMATSVCKNP